VKARRRRTRPFSILVVALVIVVFGALGFRVGRTERPSGTRATSAWATAAAAAYAQTRDSAYRLAWGRAYRRGWTAGTAAARTAGTRAGLDAGRARIKADAQAARALAAALPPAPIKLTASTTLDKCVPVGGGLCEVLGPSVTGKPCPSGSVPNPEGGVVCVPRLLKLAARLANAASAGTAR
jgi:hypothetical protein